MLSLDKTNTDALRLKADVRSSRSASSAETSRGGIIGARRIQTVETEREQSWDWTMTRLEEAIALASKPSSSSRRILRRSRCTGKPLKCDANVSRR